MTGHVTPVFIPKDLFPILGNAVATVLPDLDEGDYWKFSIGSNHPNVNKRMIRLSLHRDTIRTRKWWDFSQKARMGHEVLGIVLMGYQGEITTADLKAAVQKCLNYPSRINTYRVDG